MLRVRKEDTSSIENTPPSPDELQFDGIPSADDKSRRQRVTRKPVLRSVAEGWGAGVEEDLNEYVKKLELENRAKTTTPPVAPPMPPPITHTRFLELDNTYDIPSPKHASILALPPAKTPARPSAPSSPVPLHDEDNDHVYLFNSQFDINTQQLVKHDTVVCSCRDKVWNMIGMVHTCPMCKVVYCASCMTKTCVQCSHFAGNYLNYIDTTTPVTTDLLEPVLLHDPTPAAAPPLDEYIPLQANKTVKGYTEGRKVHKGSKKPKDQGGKTPKAATG